MYKHILTLRVNVSLIVRALAIGLLPLSCFAQALQSTGIDSTTGAITWAIQSNGVHFSLTQILVEQAQAFYTNRGFTLERIEPYAESCVYMAVLRNDSAPGAIHFVSNQWTVLYDGKPRALVSVDMWVQRLSTEMVSKSALVAFRWAQFPPEQIYEPGGDWNQGMLSVGLPSGSRFDIIARWDIDGREYQTRLEGVQCAK